MSKKTFHTHSFVVSFGCRCKLNAQGGAHGGENIFESAAIVDIDCMTEVNFQKYILHETSSKVLRKDAGYRNEDDKACEVTHGCKHMGCHLFMRGEAARFP